MMLRNFFTLRACLKKKFLVTENIFNLSNQLRNYNGIICNRSSYFTIFNENRSQRILYNLINQRCYCKEPPDASEVLRHEKELKKLTEIFPQPRVTLNELQTKTPDKIFEIQFKQNVVTPKGKGKKKKAIQNNDWHCTYVFTWPEKIKFESTAISKRQAQEKAATLALHWLYINNRIDQNGTPVYDKKVLNDLRSTLNEQIRVTISDKSAERIEKIWTEYESRIRDIYEDTFKEARQRLSVSPVALNKDSTIDEDDFSENDADSMAEETDISETKTNVHPVFGKYITPPTQSAIQRRERALERIFDKYNEELTPLPIDEYAEQITSTLDNNRVVVIVGAAGCGKSTRVPAAVLRHYGASMTAVVSEPRRVAAIGLAERVASELGEDVGDSVGYQVRLHAKPPRPPGGAILYCTSGVLLRRLQANPGLQGCSHVFIDEAHERDVNTDVTLLLLKRALDVNDHLKVVVMSATLDVGVFTKYFDPCPVIEVPGRTFPVEVTHLKDIQKKFNLNLPNTLQNSGEEARKPQINCQEVAEVIKAVDKSEKEGAILVFLPGWSEIKQTKELLEAHYGESSLHLILPVHSRLSTTDQAKMFSKPPLGIRKIVLATNVAETSITIPDVVHVIDSGAHKENRIMENTGTASLETVWVSQAGAKQRTGRAGRVQPGHCYRLYTKEKEAEFAEHTTPEILRIPLEQTVLDCKSYAPEDKVEDFLSQLPEPPTRQAIRFAVNDLVDLGALTPSERLTRLGTLLSRLTLHPRLGRSLLHGAVLGAVVPVANVLTHCADHLELFRNAPDRRDEVRSIKRKYSATSDHSALHWIQDEFELKLEEDGWSGVDAWCERYGIRKERLGYVRALSSLHLQQILKSSIIDPASDVQELNRFCDIDQLYSAVLLSGANALVTSRRRVKTKGKLATVTELYTSTAV
ncbi:ATP-dependent RNA helicase DHX30-like isoform X2 [Manduca sexta]|uniref:ATP-dependent RNA helicase DHX30-like isoform X2 n=1 Tax=Manduca sexta TaxID=7130 RepID=UPI0018902801|nr:ATP-dependent RNA helicase DHX30-like isoform X2 [Manduca sexta]